MISRPRLVLLGSAFLAAVAVAVPFAQAPGPKPPAPWFKGNLHTHTVNSDGDSTPDDVVTYSSTGVQMQAVDATASSLSLSVRTEPASKYRIQFIGRQGRVLSEVTTPTATYTFTGDEGYVRAKVMESNGKVAWIQPVPVGAGGPR